MREVGYKMMPTQCPVKWTITPKRYKKLNNNQDIQQLRGILMKLGLVMLTFALILGSCAYLNKKFNLPDDNLVEQSVEEAIEYESGVAVDLTPGD